MGVPWHVFLDDSTLWPPERLLLLSLHWFHGHHIPGIQGNWELQTGFRGSCANNRLMRMADCNKGTVLNRHFGWTTLRSLFLDHEWEGVMDSWFRMVQRAFSLKAPNLLKVVQQVSRSSKPVGNQWIRAECRLWDGTERKEQALRPWSTLWVF